MKFKKPFTTKSRWIYLFLVISLFFIGSSTITMFYASDPETNQDFFSDIGNPKSSYEISLDYNEYVVVSVASGSGDRLHWSFSGTNDFVGITVVVMDSSNYADMQNNDTFDMEILSDGTFYIKSGDYYPGYSSTWYFLFWNYDPDQETTYLTYDVELYPGGPDILLIAIIVSVVSAAVIAVIVVIIIYRRKSKRKAELIQEPIVKPAVKKPPVITQPVKPIVEKPPIITQPVKSAAVTQPAITKPVKPEKPPVNFCSICGLEVEGRFCRKCGVEIFKSEVEREKIIQDIQKVFQVSGIRIDLEMLRDILPMDASEFNSKIFDLADQFDFKIELEILHLSEEKKEDFINALIEILKA